MKSGLRQCRAVWLTCRQWIETKESIVLLSKSCLEFMLGGFVGQSECVIPLRCQYVSRSMSWAKLFCCVSRRSRITLWSYILSGFCITELRYLLQASRNLLVKLVAKFCFSLSAANGEALRFPCASTWRGRPQLRAIASSSNSWKVFIKRKSTG